MLQDATANNTTRWLELIRAHQREGQAPSLGATMVRLARLAAAQHQFQAGDVDQTEDAMCVRANGLARRPVVSPLATAVGLSMSGSVVTEDDR